jgi:signal transduction histidine kinase
MRFRQQRQNASSAGLTPSANGATSRETALAARVAELEDELRARDDFLAIAAHELRNPMTPISARLELLLTKAHRMPDRVSAVLLKDLEHLERLVSEYLRRATTLLDVARVSSGKFDLQTFEIDLSAVIRQVAINMEPLAECAGCRIRIAVEDGVSARCDPMAIEQILENLLSNAIRFGAGQPVEVGFVSDGGLARLSVRDRGIGISDHEQGLIFERFRRSGPVRPNGGFGVGLWITRQLVRAMQGEIDVSSKPGGGSTFIVRLPLSPGDKDHAG